MDSRTRMRLETGHCRPDDGHAFPGAPHPMTRTTHVTRLLERSRDGDSAATGELMPLIYERLHALAAKYLGNEAPGHTLQATALVHEAYMRLAGNHDSWHNRAHFFGAAANSVRRILVEHARSKQRKAGKLDDRMRVDVAELAADGPADHILAVDEAVERLSRVNPQQARMVEMRFFGGMHTNEIAEALGISPRTIARDWVLAKAWLARALRRDGVDH